MANKGCYRISIVLAFSCRRAKTEENDSNTSCVDAYFFEMEERYLLFQTYRDTLWTGPKSCLTHLL